MGRFNEIRFNESLFNAGSRPLVVTPTVTKRPYRSHLTQQMKNYFDETDTKAREVPYTLEGQLLNSCAVPLEESQMRISRELGTRNFRDVALNLDNQGVWYAVRIPPEVVTINSIAGFVDGAWTPLQPSDEFLQVPSSIAYDSSRSSVACSTVTLFTLSGTGLPQEVRNVSLALPNRLYFWLDGMEENAFNAEVRVFGSTFPRNTKALGASLDQETIRLTDIVSEGHVIWDSIDRIEISNVPSGATLKAILFPFGAPYQHDPLRPYYDPGYRDVTFNRFWDTSGGALKEVYYGSKWGSFETIQVYPSTDEPATVLALEPNTYGLFIVQGTSLGYCDRREGLPTDTARTASVKEALNGLTVSYDAGREDRKVVIVRPVSYAGSPNTTQYRYHVEYPDGSLYVLTPEGNLLAMTGTAGWRRGIPSKEITFPIDLSGTYAFTLESMDQYNRITQETTLYVNPGITPLTQLDSSAVVPSVRGLGFDAFQQLWIWTGDFLVPVKLVYDLYSIDTEQRMLYVSRAYDKVRIL